jgi:hypothetical protein
MKRTQQDIDSLIDQFDAWVDGFVNGSRISEEPKIFTQVRAVLLEYHEDLCK